MALLAGTGEISVESQFLYIGSLPASVDTVCKNLRGERTCPLLTKFSKLFKAFNKPGLSSATGLP